jgi:hypothetical protein
MALLSAATSLSSCRAELLLLFAKRNNVHIERSREVLLCDSSFMLWHSRLLLFCHNDCKSATILRMP